MQKNELLSSIAETGYNVGFGAKKHFATFDMAEKLPGLIGFISIATGILSLVFDSLSAKLPSAMLTIFGVATLFLVSFINKKDEYENAGIKLTELYNELRDLYRSVRQGADVNDSFERLKEIEQQYYLVSISNQAFLSDAYAHYKFFGQQQYDWIDEQKNFTWRDKIPAGFFIVIPLMVVGTIIFLLYQFL